MQLALDVAENGAGRLVDDLYPCNHRTVLRLSPVQPSVCKTIRARFCAVFEFQKDCRCVHALEGLDPVLRHAELTYHADQLAVITPTRFGDVTLFTSPITGDLLADIVGSDITMGHDDPRWFLRWFVSSRTQRECVETFERVWAQFKAEYDWSAHPLQLEADDPYAIELLPGGWFVMDHQRREIHRVRHDEVETFPIDNFAASWKTPYCLDQLRQSCSLRETLNCMASTQPPWRPYRPAVDLTTGRFVVAYTSGGGIPLPSFPVLLCSIPMAGGEVTGVLISDYMPGSICVDNQGRIIYTVVTGGRDSSIPPCPSLVCLDRSFKKLATYPNNFGYVQDVTFNRTTGVFVGTTTSGIFLIEANQWLPATFIWEPSAHRHAPSDMVRCISTVTLLRMVATHSNLTLMPNELLFLIFSFL